MWVRVVIAVVLLLLPTAVFAQTEKRIALLIGNKDYKPGVGSLTNPLNDIRIVGEALKAVGFEVLKPVENAQRATMLLAIHAFAIRLKAAGPHAVGFLYYSGHGIASEGENYLIPTDVDEPSTVLLRVQGVKQSEVLAVLRNEAPNAAHYLVLDACRNTLQGARGGKGFVLVGQQSGVLVAFATEPGKTATDLGKGSGPYAAALAAELVKPAQSDLLMFHKVRVAVMDKTNGDQVPWTEDGIQRRERVLFGIEGGEKKDILATPEPLRITRNLIGVWGDRPEACVDFKSQIRPEWSRGKYLKLTEQIVDGCDIFEVSRVGSSTEITADCMVEGVRYRRTYIFGEVKKDRVSLKWKLGDAFHFNSEKSFVRCE
jgi:Caspase domain